MPLLDGKTILVTGVLTEGSIAFHVARLAQEQGAQVVLTSFGRGERLTGRSPGGCPTWRRWCSARRHVPADLAALAERSREHADRLDGVVHAIGFAPQSCLGGDFLGGRGPTSRPRCRSRPSRSRRWRSRCGR